MRSQYRISQAQLRETFSELRRCGNGKRECQVLWLSPWGRPGVITEIVHPRHSASAVSFDLDERWLHDFWTDLSVRQMGVRAQVHTHPGSAFHSHVDDRWPIVQTVGFLSLVVPHFAQGVVGFDDAYVTAIDPDGRWVRVEVNDRIVVTR